MLGTTLPNAWRFATLTIVLSGCLLDRAPLEPQGCVNDGQCDDGKRCVAGQCVAESRDAGQDGGVTFDSGTDAGVDAGRVEPDGGTDGGTDGGPPGHCFDGEQNMGEAAVDCGGGACPGCPGCTPCTSGVDCASGRCADDRLCDAVLERVLVPGLGEVGAFVEGGRVLLARYAGGLFNGEYDPDRAQTVSETGGIDAPADWAPDACHQYGHIAFGLATPGPGRRVRIECGPSQQDLRASVASSLFSDFSDGVHGSLGAAGSPGWAAVGAIGSGQGRANAGMCGSATFGASGGIGYCSGPAAGPSNHLASYNTSYDASSGVGQSTVFCGGATCPTCDLWVWLE